MKNLIREVHRRSLWQVLGIYLAGSWVALQVVEQLAEAANLPEWVRPAALALLVIGFPIVMATAFVQEGLSSRGGASTGIANAAVDESAAAAPTAGSGSGAASLLTWRNALIGGVGAFALWGVAVTVMMFLGVGPAGGGEARDAGERISIAVLPFHNIADDDQSHVFALGIHDDLLTRLSKIGSLRVTSRTSVMGYAENPKPIPEIAEELGVQYVLEGSVLGSGGQVNINAQLIDGDSDEHLWAETYNRALSVSGVFAIQKDLAQKITESLSAALLPEEVAVIEAPPTDDLDAYNFYLRGHAYFQGGPRSDDFELAIEMYERAVELDPEFAEAWARLSFALGLQYEIQRRPDPDLPVRALEAAERAFELNPDLPEAALAFGQYYYVRRELDLAMENLTRAGQGSFHAADVFHLLGATQRRQGDIEGSISSWEEMVRLDPLSAHYYDDLGSSLAYAARWEEADEALRRALELDPRLLSMYGRRAELAIGQGDLDGAQGILDMLSEDEWSGYHRFVQWQILMYRRDFAGAADVAPGMQLRTVALEQAGDPRARDGLDSMLVQSEARLERSPEDAQAHSDLAYVYGALGRRDEAVAAADRSIELQPIDTDFIEGTSYLFTKALVHARFGEVDAALDALDTLVSKQLPGDYTNAYIELESGFDAVRDHPRFTEILQKNSLAGAVEGQ